MLDIKVASVDSIIVYLGDKISVECSQEVQSLYKKLKKSKMLNICNLVPSYTSILIQFNIFNTDINTLIENVKKIYNQKDDIHNNNISRLVEIPVYYGKNLDLEEVAKINNLSVEEVIEIHTLTEYLVYSIGFLPGFAYMGEVDEKIATPRVANPRAKLPKGSVSIADNQAAIYPKESPGGWRVLGITPLEMFDLDYDGFSYLKVGDRVKYRAISKDEFLSLGGKL